VGILAPETPRRRDTAELIQQGKTEAVIAVINQLRDGVHV
jgi:hypothetical protein